MKEKEEDKMERDRQTERKNVTLKGKRNIYEHSNQQMYNSNDIKQNINTCFLSFDLDLDFFLPFFLSCFFLKLFRKKMLQKIQH